MGTSSGASPRWQRRYAGALVLADGAAVLVPTLVAQAIPQSLGVQSVSGQMSFPLLAGGLSVLWVSTVAICGVYDSRRIGNGSDEYRGILNAAVRFLAFLGVLSLAFKLAPGRGFLATALVAMVTLTVLNHYVARRWLSARRADGQCSQRVLVVGLESQVVNLVRHFRRAGYVGLLVVGACVPSDEEKINVDDEPVRVVGGMDDIIDALREVEADVVAITDHESLHNGALRRLGWQLEGTGADLLVAPSVIDVAGPRIAVRPVAGLPLLHVEEPHLTGPVRALKQAIDAVLAAVLLLVLSPVFIAIGVALRLSSRGPAIFKQGRVGQDGRPFTLYKFRTMKVNAEVEPEWLNDHNDMDGPLFKMRDDPRRTPFGRWLRRYSLDELPQLCNVLLGDMSIVGPRPPLPVEVAGYSDEVRRRLLVKPGITGLWQVSGRSDLPWLEATRLDLHYVDNWSPGLDLVILAKTVSAVLRGTGAY